MSILMVTGIEGAKNCATAMAGQLGMEVVVASRRREVLTALRKREFKVVIIDESIADCDPATADSIWAQSGLAIPLQINFALSGVVRLVREIKAALQRREREQALAGRAAAVAIQSELKSTLAGLLLHSELVLKGNSVPAPVADRLRVVADLAGTLRRQLNVPMEMHGNTGL